MRWALEGAGCCLSPNPSQITRLSSFVQAGGCRVDCSVYTRGGLGEGDVAFDAASADPADTTGLRPSVPGVSAPVGRADVQLAAGGDHPHGHIRPETSIG